jgi:DNA polymerase
MYNNYQEFNKCKSECRKCVVGHQYNKVVTSVGNTTNPAYLLIGEAPGETEVEKGQPFCGPAGKILREELIKNELTMGNTCISNTLPCRPFKNQFPSDKNLVTRCISMWLLEEISLLKPKCLLLIGSTPMKYILGSPGPITEIRGQIFYDLHIEHPDGENSFSDKYNLNIPTMVVFHPSYILRNGRTEFGLFIRGQFNTDIAKFKSLGDGSKNPTF